MFKLGDKVRCIDAGNKSSGWEKGREFIILFIIEYHDGAMLWGAEGAGVWENSVELINNNKIMSNVKEKFVTLFTKEPEKTFRKEGITNGDGFLTEEGQQVFLGYLLNKYGDEFKKEVVDEIAKNNQ